MNNEILVQLDLEGGFAVGQELQSKTAVVKEEFDEYYDCEYTNSKDSVKQEFGNHDANGVANEIGKQAAKEESHETSIKEEFDGDAYCMEENSCNFSPYQDEFLASSHIKEKTKVDELSTETGLSTKTKRTITPRQTKMILGPPPSLLRHTMQVISSNLEKYHPCSFSIFSECQWESIVECRCESFDKLETSLPRNRNKLLMPPISQKILGLIEAHPANSHLTKSKKVDILLWSRIVDYSYPRRGMTRPPVLNEPYDVLITRLVEWGEKLVGLFEWKEKQDINNIDPNNGSRRSRYDDRPRAKSFTESEDSDPDNVEDNNCKKYTIEIQDEHDRLIYQSLNATKELECMLQAIQCSPMDVKLLSDSGVGKCVSKAVKIATRLLKQTKHLSEDELCEALNGYPRFWIQGCTLCQIGNSNPYTEFKPQVTSQRINREEKSKNVSLLQVLQQLLQEWKIMASKNGVAMSSSTTNTPPSKKLKIDSKVHKTLKSDQDEIMQPPFATFGKPRNMDVDQHEADIKLLHSSKNWKALYNSLQKRERMMREAHGEKVRASRQSLERNRPKIGKVTLKKAVGRVRGLGAEAPSCTTNLPVKGQARREAILNKSLGTRAKEARAISAASSTSSGSSNKLSKLRQESKVASKWSKGTQKTVSKISHTSDTILSSFGASVARAGCNNNTSAATSKLKLVGKQARVDLQGGKRMTLPANASSKSVGLFSSLQSKKTEKRKR